MQSSEKCRNAIMGGEGLRTSLYNDAIGLARFFVRLEVFCNVVGQRKRNLGNHRGCSFASIGLAAVPCCAVLKICVTFAVITRSGYARLLDTLSASNPCKVLPAY